MIAKHILALYGAKVLDSSRENGTLDIELEQETKNGAVYIHNSRPGTSRAVGKEFEKMYASAPHARTPLALHRLLTTRPAPLQSADARHCSTLPCPPPASTRSTWTSPARTRTASRRTARAAPSPRARTCSFAATSSTSTWTAHTCVFARAFAFVRRPPTRPNPGSSPTPSPQAPQNPTPGPGEH